MLNGVHFQVLLGDAPKCKGVHMLAVRRAGTIVVFDHGGRMFRANLFHRFHPLNEFRFDQVRLLARSIPVPVLGLLVIVIAMAASPIRIFKARDPQFGGAERNVGSPIGGGARLRVAPLIRFLRCREIFQPFMNQ